MNVHERCAGFKSLMRALDLLFGSRRNGGVVLLARHGAGDSDSDDYGIHDELLDLDGLSTAPSIEIA
jgi:hypothetical protein